MQLTGKIIKMMPIESGISPTGKAWRKRVFLMETLDRYPKQVCFEVKNYNIDKFAAVMVGSVVTVDIELQSWEWNYRYYTTVTAWKVSISKTGQNHDR